ncbi:MAG: ATP-binding cassette domain-containing protein [Lawsonibacter sp.]|nr:ATP-binding cassette domain-containing protein [Lawsonibacter sp.]MDE6898553.1 ATP-binding cassette domain-containing protein [Lawsonibacter sp.]
MIQVEELTLQYPGGKGIRGVPFQVEEGQVIGYLGPNGAGKATTIRCLLGFSRPDGGRCSIGGMDCWQQPRISRGFWATSPARSPFWMG